MTSTRIALLCGLTSTLALGVACQAKNNDDPDAGPPVVTPDASTPIDGATKVDGATEADSGTPNDAGDEPPLEACPDYSPTNPKHHAYGQETDKAIIRADETWKASETYFVLSLFEISGCTLTIEPGTHVCLAAGNGVPPTISVSGDLGVPGKVIANGTAALPIVFDRASPSDAYSGIYFSTDSQATLDHVRFNAGGAGGLGVLRVGQNIGHPFVARDVQITSFFKTALALANADGLSNDSTIALTSQQTTSSEPIVVTSIAAAKSLTATTLKIAPTIPDTTRVLRLSDHDVRKDLTLLGSIGADYYIQSGDLNVRRGDPVDPIPTLTIEAGARVRFGEGELVVSNVGAGSEGILVANGTEAKPVILTSATLPPARGQWNGVTLYVGSGTPASTLKHVKIENAGGPGGANISSCRNPAGALAGALKLRPIVSAAYAGPTLEAVEITRSGGDGIAFGCTPSGCLTTDFVTAVTGTDNAGTLLRPLGCP